MKVPLAATLTLFTLASAASSDAAKPYRLEAVDLKQRVIWGASSLDPAGHGLSFGGQDQDANDGRPHTHTRVGDKWQSITKELRENNSLQTFHRQGWALRTQAKNLRAKLRYLYFQGRSQTELAPTLKKLAAERSEVIRALGALGERLSRVKGESYETAQARIALSYLEKAAAITSQQADLSPTAIQNLREAQILIEKAAEACDAEPSARALDCGTRRGESPPAGSKGLIYDPTTQLYLLFGGDHLDYLRNDTWVFDPAKAKWFQRHPKGAPAPRANHRLESLGDGRIRLSGGYTYASNTDYVGGQYIDLEDGPWIYDLRKNSWSGGVLMPADTRTYRTGPFHPDFYLQGERPDAEAFEAKLAALPANRWITTDPPFRPRMNRDWGMAVLDPHRDMMLRWSGGHSAHGGTDVPHFHFATNRWELPFPVEFPLGQLYSNTSYPNGFNFNGRPWMTGHTYQNYHYDPLSQLMVKAGRPRHHYLYDPEIGDWIGRGAKPDAMRYNSCFYTLTLASTPSGIHCWDKNGRVHRFDRNGAGGNGSWRELELAGAKLPGAVVDNSTIAYDANRNRLLMVTKPYGKAPFDGQVWSLDLTTNQVSALSPAGMERAQHFAYLDRCVYDPTSDLILMASFLTGSDQAATRTPAFDCAGNRWITLELNYDTGKRGDRITRAFPHGRSCGIMFDPKRKLIWGTDTNSQVFVLRLDATKAQVKPL